MRDLWQVAEHVHGDSEIEVIRPTDWLSIRDSGCKSDEQCRSLRPILKPACLIDMAKLPHLHDAASPLACSPASILDRAIWIMCGRRPRCKKNLTFGLRSGASHVSGLFARQHDRWP